MDAKLLDVLRASPERESVTRHPFFETVKVRPLTKEHVSTILAQYWYPIEYFTTYLSRTIAALPTEGAIRTVVSKILWQELGEGTYDKAHLNLYIKTMTDVGFHEQDIVNAHQLAPTRKLVDGYRASTDHHLDALGWLYGTEVIDLTICTGLGRAIRRVTGAKDLPWVNIHALQEPDHVAVASSTMGSDGQKKKGRRAGDAPLPVEHDAQASSRIQVAAADCWVRWRDFFSAMDEHIKAGHITPDAVAEARASGQPAHR